MCGKTWNTMAIAVLAAFLIWAYSRNESGDASHLLKTTDDGQRWDVANLHNTPEYKAWLARTTIKIPETWEPVSVTLLLQDGTQAKVSGRRGTYVFQTQGGFPEDWPAVAFVDPSSGHAWVGREMDIYVQDKEGIVGVQNFSPSFYWYESSIPDLAAGKRIDSLTDQYNDQKKYLGLNDPPTVDTFLRDDLSPWFFYAHPGSSQAGFAKILETHVSHGQLEMALESPGGDRHAQVWIDLSTRKLVKAVEDGKGLLPKDRK